MDENENVESDMMSLFGVTGTAEAATETAATETTEEQTQQVTNTSEETTENAAPATTTASETSSTANNQTKDTPFDPEEKFNTKQNSAFAQMRIQNKELSDLIMGLAKATGQSPKNIAEATDMIKQGYTKVISEKRNIPEDVLREMENDKRALEELKQTQAKERALAGFQKVKDTFALSREDVNAFADQLIANNMNPFEQNLDLEREYKLMYFDKLIQNAKEAGIQEERARSLKAQQNSSAPSTQRGLPDNTGNQVPEIKTVADLNKLLDGLK